MPAQVVTTDDLYILKIELIEEIKKLFSNSSNEKRKWLKSPDVRQMLSISAGTLQTLRINGTLPYTKMGGAIYYAYDDIVKVLEKNKKNKR